MTVADAISLLQRFRPDAELIVRAKGEWESLVFELDQDTGSVVIHAVHADMEKT